MIPRGFVLLSLAAGGAAGSVFDNEQLRVRLREDFPHVLRHEHKPTGGVLLGADERDPRVVEINGERYQRRARRTCCPAGATRFLRTDSAAEREA